MEELENTSPKYHCPPDNMTSQSARQAILAAEVLDDAIKASQWLNKTRRLFGDQSSVQLMQAKKVPSWLRTF